MSEVINQVVRASVPGFPQLRMISVHRREIGGIADAEWIRFACENPNDPAVIGCAENGLQEIIAEYQAKKAKQETSTPEQTAE